MKANRKTTDVQTSVKTEMAAWPGLVMSDGSPCDPRVWMNSAELMFYSSCEDPPLVHAELIFQSGGQTLVCLRGWLSQKILASYSLNDHLDLIRHTEEELAEVQAGKWRIRKDSCPLCDFRDSVQATTSPRNHKGSGPSHSAAISRKRATGKAGSPAKSRKAVPNDPPRDQT